MTKCHLNRNGYQASRRKYVAGQIFLSLLFGSWAGKRRPATQLPSLCHSTYREPQHIPRAEASRAGQHSTFSTSLATSNYDVHIQGRRTTARAFTYHASKAPPTLPRTRRVYRARFVIPATMRPMVMYLEPAECNRAQRLFRG